MLDVKSFSIFNSNMKLKIYKTLSGLNNDVIGCRLCPRLVEYRETAPPRAAFKDQTYWRKPVPGFGDPDAWLLILGLAPAANGGNRTGRIFTGDNSGRFLYKALYEEGFANQATWESADDGLILKGCYLTAIVKCAPPQNKPLPQEFKNCSRYWHEELRLLKNAVSVLALGKHAFDAYKAYVKSQGENVRDLVFKHGAGYSIENMPTLYASYHPSQQNTFTGVLTETMFRGLLGKIKNDRRAVD